MFTSLLITPKHASFLGGGLVLIDVGTRAGNVHISKLSGENWQRELFVESSSFLASVIAGTAAVKVGVAGLTFLMVATSLGWVGLIVGGAAVAGVAVTTSIKLNNIVKHNAGGFYDSLMQQVLVP